MAGAKLSINLPSHHLWRSPGHVSLEVPDIPRSPATSENSENPDGELAEQLNRKFAIQFAQETRDIAKSKRHTKVAVLLFSWRNEGQGDYIDTTEEVQQLGEVFKHNYHYTVHEKWLSTRAEEGLPKHQLSYYVAGFIKDHDAKDALLIVYYGGHGFKGEPAEGLRITPGSPSELSISDSNEIVLEDCIIHLKQASADVLLILDCCYADYRILEVPHNGFGKEIFETIASSGKNQVARGPGSHSFTTALTEALRDLASEMSDGFTVTSLVKKIQSKEFFSDNKQTPVCSELTSRPSYRRLKIMPLLSTANLSQPESGAPVRFYLSLQYLLTSQPTQQDISSLASACKDLVKFPKIPIQQVVWDGLSESNHRIVLAEAAARKWMSVTLARRASRATEEWHASQNDRITSHSATNRSIAAEHARDKRRLDAMNSRIDYLYGFIEAYYDRTLVTSIVIAFLLGVVIARKRKWMNWIARGKRTV